MFRGQLRIRRRMVDKLRDHLAMTNTEEATVNILDWIGRATMDIMGIVGFGHDFQCGESPEAQAINEIWTKLVVSGMELPGFIAPLVIRIFPWLLNLPVKAMETQGAIRGIVRDIALRIVTDRETAQEEPGKDLLSALLSTLR